jgi:hypothetical protein
VKPSNHGAIFCLTPLETRLYAGWTQTTKKPF